VTLLPCQTLSIFIVSSLFRRRRCLAQLCRNAARPSVCLSVCVGRSQRSCCSFCRWFSLQFSTFASASRCVALPLQPAVASSSSSSRRRSSRQRRRLQVPARPDESLASRRHASPSRANPSSRCSVSVRFWRRRRLPTSYSCLNRARAGCTVNRPCYNDRARITASAAGRSFDASTQSITALQ